MEHTAAKHPKFVRWALMLGIVIVLNIFFTVLVSTALPAPKYEVYCPAAASISPAPADAESCAAADGIWNAYPSMPDQKMYPAPLGYCDLYSKCQKPYTAASDKHALYAFIAMIALGILAVVAGLTPIGSSIVSSGLSYGGVLAFVIGSAQYWGSAESWLRLGIATVALVALLYMGWKRFAD